MLKELTMAVGMLLFIIGGSVTVVSCSKKDSTTDVYANWQKRNDAFMASLEDSLAHGQGKWMKFKSYSRNPQAGGDYVYAVVFPTGAETGQTTSPTFTDSVRVCYEGRLMPTAIPLNGKGYYDGMIFDSTFYGSYDPKTNATARFKVSDLVNGFSTALMHMHRGDTWIVYIPYTLGYGSAAKTLIPAYSTLIYKLTLYDFTADGIALPPM